MSVRPLKNELRNSILMLLPATYEQWSEFTITQINSKCSNLVVSELFGEVASQNQTSQLQK